MALTAVEWLAEKYNYITWMRNRDEISAGTADQWRREYLEQAKQMEKGQIEDAYMKGNEHESFWPSESAVKYYKETYGTQLQNETN